METGGTKRESSAPYPVPRMGNSSNNTGVDSVGGGVGSPMSGYANQVSSGRGGDKKTNCGTMLVRESPPPEQCPPYLWTVWTSWAELPPCQEPRLDLDLSEAKSSPCLEAFTRELRLCKTLRWQESAPACPQPDLPLQTPWPDR